jgi:hypothetical protein
MVKAFCEFLTPHMLFNWDATQFRIDLDSNKIVVIEKDEDDDSPISRKSSGSLAFAIKLYHFHNANGGVAPAVWVVADDSMDEEDCDFFEVAGLNNVAGNSCGFLCFTKNRSGNINFYNKFLNTIIVPFVTETREMQDCKNIDGSFCRAFIYCDGEQLQIKYFKNDDVLEILKENLIDIGKTVVLFANLLMQEIILRLANRPQKIQ